MVREKILYPNQEEIRNQVIKWLKPQITGEAYIFGSLANSEFGVYLKKYKEHSGSDIDVIFFTDKIPEWKNLNISKRWWDLYRGPTFEFNGNKHIVEIIVVKKEFIDFARKRVKELKWNLVKI